MNPHTRGVHNPLVLDHLCQLNSLVPYQKEMWIFLLFGTGGTGELGELLGDAAHPALLSWVSWKKYAYKQL